MLYKQQKYNFPETEANGNKNRRKTEAMIKHAISRQSACRHIIIS